MPKRKTSKKSRSPEIKINLDKIVKACKEENKKNRWKCSGGGGFWVFGSALAMILSYTQNSSILWAIFHGIISWIYIAYRAIIFYI